MLDPRRFPWVLTAMLVMVAAGCSPDGFRRVKVKGVVTLEGKPLANADLRFLPLADRGDEAIGLSGADGSFTLASARHGIAGAVPGEYAVIVNLPEFELQPVDPAEGTAVAPPAGKNPIPAVYRSQSQTPLRVTIPEGGGSITIELTVPPKRQSK